MRSSCATAPHCTSDPSSVRTRTRCTISSAPCRPTPGRSASCRWGSTCVQRPGTQPRWTGATGWGSSRSAPTAGSSRMRCTSGVDPESAEVAFAVADEWQGHGLGTVLLGLVAEIASRAGIPQFVALVRADNRRMVDVFRESGFPASVRARSGVVEVELPTALGAEALAAFEDRDRVAATSAVARFLLPRSVALIGASDRPGSVGAALLQNLRGSFTGPIHLVNHRRSDVGGTPAFRSVAAASRGRRPGGRGRAGTGRRGGGARLCAQGHSRAARGVRRLRGRRRRRRAPGAAARASAGRPACASSGPTASDSR